ncbi:Hypothetical predicted protein [Cloeon dipterum]|uniref:Crossover junction endonuclease MUS81 n=1 Tax=Cloeon dipterum TaxID=197152 RepID=A0A8S1E535_9INSE|nr:Hypothetical predicted protein [Cloeon dipterum]
MASSEETAKRRKVKHVRPNALFEQWITEWRDEAKEKGLQTAYTYNKALASLKLYPLPFKSGKECSLLKNFGAKLCSMLDKRIEEYKAANPDDTRFSSETSGLPKPSPTKKANSPKKRRAPAKKKQTQPEEDIVEDLETVSVQIAPGQVQVKLIVDCSETAAQKASQKMTAKELELQGIPYEVRDLNVGDFLWLAIAPDGTELVLPFIVERKRSDDLAHSIKGSRYHEQKMRLKMCGLNVIYLIEATKHHTALPQETLYQAQTNTNIVDKFCVHNTSNVKETVSYLATMTRVLQRKMNGKFIKSCGVDDGPEYSLSAQTLCLYSFKEFQQGSVKIENFTVREMFAQLLLQIQGTSVDSVCAVVEKFPTLAHMRGAFANCDSLSEKIGLLTVLQFGPSKRSLPYEVAKRIVHFFTVRDFEQIQ